MTETGGHNGEEFLSEEARKAEHTRLFKNMLNEEERIVFDGSTDPRQLDKYLEAMITLDKWIAHHPVLKDKEGKGWEFEHHSEEALKYRKILDGSYYEEKALFCREKADRLKGIAGERTDEIGVNGRRQAARWLRMEASCLEMPTPRPPAPGQQEQTP